MTFKKKRLIFSRDQHSKKTLSPDEIKMQKARLKYSSQAGSLLLCSGQRRRQAVGGKPISAVPYVTPSCPQTTYLFQMSLEVTILEHIWTSQHLLCSWPVIFRAARLSLICSKRAHSWVHRTGSWEVTTALSSHHWRRCLGAHKNLNKKLHISLQMLHKSLPHHSAKASLQLTQVDDLLAPLLHWFHINKQQWHEAITPSMLTIPVFYFSEGFQPSLWLKSVQNLKRNSWAIFAVESSMKLMLDLLHPKPSGLHLSLPYMTVLPWWALSSYIPDFPGIFTTSSFFFSSLHPQHTIFLEVWPEYKRHKIFRS